MRCVLILAHWSECKPFKYYRVGQQDLCKINQCKPTTSLWVLTWHDSDVLREEASAVATLWFTCQMWTICQRNAWVENKMKKHVSEETHASVPHDEWNSFSWEFISKNVKCLWDPIPLFQQVFTSHLHGTWYFNQIFPLPIESLCVSIMHPVAHPTVHIPDAFHALQAAGKWVLLPDLRVPEKTVPYSTLHLPSSLNTSVY